MINDGIASIINKRLKHSENCCQTRVSESAQRIWCVDVAGKLECEWYLRHPIEGIGHSKGEARIAKPALKIAGIMIVAWLLDIGLVGIILFIGRIGGVGKVRPQQCGHRGSLTVPGDVNWASRGHLACQLNKNAVIRIFKKQERSQSKTEMYARVRTRRKTVVNFDVADRQPATRRYKK